jgi:AmiR/NasT family two-component response regulator
MISTEVLRAYEERAKGVLMQRESLSEEEAYLAVQRQARKERRTIRRVAEAILRQARDDRQRLGYVIQ